MAPQSISTVSPAPENMYVQVKVGPAVAEPTPESQPATLPKLDGSRSRSHSSSGSSSFSSSCTQQPGNPFVVLALLVLMGFFFGFLFERSHVYEPSSIRLQFVFRRWMMLKMFMGAVAGACFSFWFWKKMDKDMFEGIRSGRNVVPMPWATVAIGSCMLGAGMAISGACPGMVLPQVGTQVHNALFTLAGGFAGAFLYNMCLWVFIVKNLHGLGVTAAEKDAASDYKSQYADLRWGLPLDKCLIAFGAFGCVFCLVAELLVPYKDELHDYNSGIWHSSAWPPSLCGIGIGLINLGTVYAASAPMGSSTAYAQVAGKEFLGTAHTPDPSISLATSFLQKHWQVPYLVTSVLGAYISGLLSDNVPSETPGIPSKALAFFGGVLMLFGSRLGGGCTSGHGIAGMPLLNLKAIFGVCGMFAAGIAVALVMDQAGELEL